MKRFFSFCLAIAAAVSASAMPFSESVPFGTASQLVPSVVMPSKALPGEDMAVAAQAQPHFRPTLLPITARAEEDAITLNATVMAWRYTEASGSWYLGLMDVAQQYAFYFDYNSETLEGTFETSDLNLNYCMVQTMEGNVRIQSATLTVIRGEREALGVEATVTDANGQVYRIAAERAPIPEEVKETKTITATNMLIDSTYIESEGAYLVNASSAEFPMISLTIYPSDGETLYGEYGKFDLSLLMSDAEGNSYYPTIADADVRILEEDGIDKVTGSIVGFDSIRYVFDLSFVLPEVKEEITVTATNLVIDDSWTSFAGVYIFSASDATREVILQLKNSSGVPNGDYYVGQIDRFYVVDIATNDTLAPYAMEAELTATIDGQGDRLSGTILTDDGVRYTLDLSWLLPQPQSQVTLNFPNAQFTQIRNAFYFTGAAVFSNAGLPEGYDAIGLQIAINSSIVAGSYGPESVFRSFTRLAYLNSTDENKALYRQVALRLIKIVENTEAGTYTLTANVFSEDGVMYRVTMVAPIPATGGLEYDATSGAVDRTYTDADEISFAAFRNYTDLALFEAQGVNAQGTRDEVALLFFAGSLNEETVVPVGTYTIDHSGEYGTVQASSGVTNNSVTYSFYGALTATGSITNPVYFLTSGTVEVAQTAGGALRLTVDAQNSNGLPVKITYESTATALRDTDSESVATKRITRDGQLQIIRGDKVYDATGAILK